VLGLVLFPSQPHVDVLGHAGTRRTAHRHLGTGARQPVRGYKGWEAGKELAGGGADVSAPQESTGEH